MGTVKSPSYRQRVAYQSMLLGGFSMLATALLVVGNIATSDAIRERQLEDLDASLAQVVPAEFYDNNILQNPILLMSSENPVTVYRGALGSQINALAWEITGAGYAGDIRLILGLDQNGKILGVRTLSHAETPGLGDKIEVEKNDWITGFNGKSLGTPPHQQWKVTKDGGQFDVFSGATITPRSVVAAVLEGLEFYREHKDTLLAPLQKTSVNSTQEEKSE